MPKLIYTCSCPDYQRRHEGNPFSRGVTSSQPQQWGDTVREGYCKHIYSVLVKRRELDFSSIPTDIPIEKNPRKSIKTGFVGKIHSKDNVNPFNW